MAIHARVPNLSARVAEQQSRPGTPSANALSIRRAGRLGDTYVLDLASWTWRQVQYGQGSARPARRAFHSATAVDGRVVLFGGAARREGAAEVYYQDTWLYVDADRTWREVEMAGAVPAGRAAHSACLIEPGGSIVVFGGTNGQRPFDELWLLHVEASKWRAYVESKPSYHP